MSARDPLSRLLKKHNRVMVQDKSTTVTFITDTNHVANVVDSEFQRLIARDASAVDFDGVADRHFAARSGLARLGALPFLLLQNAPPQLGDRKNVRLKLRTISLPFTRRRA